MAIIPLNVKLDKIQYQGDSVGREWTFDIFVGSQQTILPRTVRPNKTVGIGQVVYQESLEVADSSSLSLPIRVTATEQDPAYQDMGQGLGSFEIMLGMDDPQQFALSVGVQEVRPLPETPPQEPVPPKVAQLTFFFSAAEVKPTLPPKMIAVTPTRGPVKGGTTVEIKGENFVEGCSVRFDGVVAKNITFVNGETLTVTTPRHPMAGKVNVRVINPDGEKDTLEKGFQYDGVPLIFEVVSDEGPAIPPEDTETKFQVVKILGLHFQEGIEVSFAKSPAKVIFVDPDGQLLKVEVPRRVKKGAVNVKVKNPDGGKATLTDGFTYLGPKQQQRVRIRKVVPLTLFDNSPKQKIIVYGRNVHDAVDNGLLGLRVPSRLALIYDSVEKLADPDTEEEMVVYNITPVSNPPLEGPERMILLVVASRRTNARQDMVVDTSKTTVTLLPKDLPVPIGFTAKLAGGQTNLVMVAGRNLQDTTLSLNITEGVEINHQFSEDGLVAALVNVPVEMSQTPLDLILNKGGSEVGRYPLRVQMPTSNTTGMMGSMQPSQISEFEPIPEQTVLAPTEEDSVVYAVTTNPATPTLKLGPGAPQLAGNPNLITALKFTVATLNLRFFLINEVRFLPLFDRGGPDLEEEALQGTVGKILPVRNLNLIVVIRVFLDINIRVAVILSFNPFRDFKSTERFNEFPDQLTASNVYGTVVVSVVVTIQLRLTAQFFVALILPDLSLTVLAAFQLSLQITIGSRGVQLNLGVGGYIRANLPAGGRPIRPKPLLSPQGDGLQLLAEATFPDRNGLGRLAYYFAREAGEYCLDWDYGDFEIVQAFQSGGKEDTLFKPSTVVTCVLITKKNLHVIRIDPDPVKVERGATEIIRAFAREVDKKGQPKGKEIELRSNEVKFVPSSANAPFVTELDMCKKGNCDDQLFEWYVRGIQVAESNIKVRVKGVGKDVYALFPEDDFNFILFPFVSDGEKPLIEVTPKDEAGNVSGQVNVVEPGSTVGLSKERNRLLQDFAKRRYPEKSLKSVWDEELTCSQKGVFLTITHRLQYSEVRGSGYDFNILKEITHLYSIKGMNGCTCRGEDNNRLFMGMSPVLKDALFKVFSAKIVPEVTIRDEAGSEYREDEGIPLWRESGDGNPHEPFDPSDETDKQEPRGQIHFFDPNKNFSDNDKTNALNKLAKRTDGIIATGTITDAEFKLLVEMDHDYNPSHNSCTEILQYDLRNEKGDVLRSVTGRILYNSHYGRKYPVDFGWHP